jgi:hypothetical protein
MPPQEPPWSAAAIGGFVASWFGCIGVGTLLGLVFGIVGIARTSAGRRRGRGLAIAAIPISLVTGVLGIFVAIFGYAGYALGSVFGDVVTAMKQAGTDRPEAVRALREVCTEDFAEAADEAAFTAWLEQVGEKHGRFVGLEQASQPQVKKGADRVAFDVTAKFVNGSANVHVAILIEGTSFKLDDLQVDGLSPRGMKP